MFLLYLQCTPFTLLLLLQTRCCFLLNHWCICHSPPLLWLMTLIPLLLSLLLPPHILSLRWLSFSLKFNKLSHWSHQTPIIFIGNYIFLDKMFFNLLMDHCHIPLLTWLLLMDHCHIPLLTWLLSMAPLFRLILFFIVKNRINLF